MSERLIVVGGGEHARVVVDAARSTDQWTVIGYLDPSVCPAMEALGVPRLGDDDQAAAGALPADCAYVIGVGGVVDTSRRRRIAERYQALGLRWATVLHLRAVISSTARVGPGAVVLAGAIVNPAADLGEHCIVNTGAVIEHDVVVERYAHVGPVAAVGGGASIGEGAYVGLGARIRDHIRVGRRAVVGMGSVVVAAVADDAQVTGVPARPLGAR